MELQLKYCEKLMDSILPFSFIVDYSGRIEKSGNSINKIFGTSIEGLNISDIIFFSESVDFDFLKEHEGSQTFKYGFNNLDILLKASSFNFSFEKRVLIDAIPIINSEYRLSSYNVNFQDFSATSVMAEYLFLVESNKRSMVEAYRLIEDVNLKNKNLTAAFNKIEKSQKELRLVKDTLVKLNENLETKVAEGIEENKKLQSEIFQQDKLSTLGELSAGVAHDLNTPLGAIQASAENIRITLEQFFKEDIVNMDVNQVHYACEIAGRDQFNTFISSREERKMNRLHHEQIKIKYNEKFDSYSVAKTFTNAQINPNEKAIISKILDDEHPLEFLKVINSITKIRKSIDTIYLGVAKSSNVIQSLKNYVFKKESIGYSPFNLVDSIKAVLTLFENEIKKGIDVHLDIEDQFEVYGAEIRLNQVWANLIKNAIQAMNNDGILKIKAEQIGTLKKVHFTNNGPRIKSKIKDQIFEPFFTTKKRNQGTGMGLSIISRIIKDHDAQIDLTSDENETCFTITFKK